MNRKGLELQAETGDPGRDAGLTPPSRTSPSRRRALFAGRVGCPAAGHRRPELVAHPGLRRPVGHQARRGSLPTQIALTGRRRTMRCVRAGVHATTCVSAERRIRQRRTARSRRPQRAHDARGRAGFRCAPHRTRPLHIRVGSLSIRRQMLLGRYQSRPNTSESIIFSSVSLNITGSHSTFNQFEAT
jgi:hypothetical protein